MLFDCVIIMSSICPVSVPSGDVGNEKKKTKREIKDFSFVNFFFFRLNIFFCNFLTRPCTRKSWAVAKEKKNTGSFVVINIDSPHLSLYPPLFDFRVFFVSLLLDKKKIIFGIHTQSPVTYTHTRLTPHQNWTDHTPS